MKSDSLPRASSLVAVEGGGDSGRNVEEIYSFPGLQFRDLTSVFLGNALYSRSYTARQEIKSPVSKSLDVTKEICLNWHGVRALTFKQGL